MEEWMYSTILSLPRVGRKCSASRPGSFTLRKRAPGTHWIGGRVRPRTGLKNVEKILDPTRTRTPAPRSSIPYPVAVPITLSRLPINNGSNVEIIAKSVCVYFVSQGQNIQQPNVSVGQRETERNVSTLLTGELQNIHYDVP
jgi:hypothetical protein